MTRVDKLNRLGVSFTPLSGSKRDPETVRLRGQCVKIFNDAQGRVDRFAGHLDVINSLRPAPLDLELSPEFIKAYGDIMLQVEAEWLQDRPDLEIFRGLVSDWVRVCILELRRQLDVLRSPVV